MALAAGAALAAAGCAEAPDVADMEERLREAIPPRAAERGVRVRDVDCPDGADLSPGSAFDCRVPAVEGGRRVVYTARVVVGEGHRVSWRLTAARAEGAATARSAPPGRGGGRRARPPRRRRAPSGS